MKKGIVILATFLVSLGVAAQEKNKKITFAVQGQCELCKMRIEKAALQVPGVKYARWEILTHQLSLIIDERKTDAMQIKTAIAAVGHDTQELKASQEAYDKIAPCCKYREGDTNDNHKH